MKRIHLTILGRVQGVYFRQETKNHADTLGVKGWVKNLADGNVETTAEGEDNTIDEFIKYCKHGPSGAVVKDIKIEEEKYNGEFKDFEIKF